MRIVSESQETTTTPATWYDVPVYRRWNGYWVRGWRTVYEPGEVRTDTVVEKDLLGEKPVPADAYYGVQTARALENFHIKGVPICQHSDLIRALAMVKLAAARANHDCGVLPDCDESLRDRYFEGLRKAGFDT